MVSVPGGAVISGVTAGGGATVGGGIVGVAGGAGVSGTAGGFGASMVAGGAGIFVLVLLAAGGVEATGILSEPDWLSVACLLHPVTAKRANSGIMVLIFMFGYLFLVGSSISSVAVLGPGRASKYHCHADDHRPAAPNQQPDRATCRQVGHGLRDGRIHGRIYRV